MNSPRQKYADNVLRKMRAKGIKPTHLRDHGFDNRVIKAAENGGVSFSKLIELDDLLSNIESKLSEDS